MSRREPVLQTAAIVDLRPTQVTVLADAMLDNVALKDLLGKNGDARWPSGGSG
jgi:hypothetical protein